MLSELLTTCGFNSSEQSLLLDLLTREKSTAGQLARRTGLKRPTVYAALEGLIQRGVVVKRKLDNLTYFSTISPSLIPKVLSGEAQRDFKGIQAATDQMLPYLEELSRTVEHKISGFEMVAMESLEAVYAQLEDTLTGGDFCAIFNPQRACVGEPKEIVKRFLKKTAVNKPAIRELTVPGPLADWYRSEIKNPNHQVYDLKLKGLLDSDIIMLNGSVYISHYEPDSERSLKITEKNYYQSMMTIFEMLWVQCAG